MSLLLQLICATTHIIRITEKYIIVSNAASLTVKQVSQTLNKSYLKPVKSIYDFKTKMYNKVFTFFLQLITDN